MNYSELVDQVKDYLETDETTFNANIDTFIKLAEEDIYRKVQVPSTRQSTAALTTTSSNRLLAVPADFLSAHEISVVDGGTYYPLVRKDVSYMREAYPTAATGIPKYYSLFDESNLVMAPTPDSTYSVELNYYGKPASIVDSSTTWIGDNAENALLFGTVLQAYIYLKGSADLLAAYKAAYDQAINNLQMLGDGLKKKDEYRHGSRRIPV